MDVPDELNIRAIDCVKPNMVSKGVTPLSPHETERETVHQMMRIMENS
jgi:hypothetical protein